MSAWGCCGALAPVVSVLMTVYNGERYLVPALEGLLQQTLGDFEVVIVDDGSTDGTAAVVADFARRDPRIRPIFSEHVGRGRALNLGLERCRGRYIAINDADDISLPHRLWIQSAFLERHERCALVAGWAAVVDEDGKVVGERRVRNSNREIKGRLALGNPLIHSSVMYRRTILEQVGGFNATLPCAIDYDAIERVLRFGDAGCVEEIVVLHRRHRLQHFRQGLAHGLRWRVSSRIAVRAAVTHNIKFLPLAMGMYFLAWIPWSGALARIVGDMHARLLLGTGSRASG